MSQPQTLLEMSGVPARPHSLAASAVVLIDAQMEYVSGRLPLSGVDKALEECARLLDLARSREVPIIHVAHRGRAGALFDPEGSNWGFAPQVAPRDDEGVIYKTLPNAFAKTDLEQRLRSLELPYIIVAGFMTHMCVSSTVRAATDLGFGTTVVAGACATRDLPAPGGTGGVVPAAEIHNAELAALADRYATVVGSTDDLVP